MEAIVHARNFFAPLKLGERSGRSVRNVRRGLPDDAGRAWQPRDASYEELVRVNGQWLLKLRDVAPKE